MVGSLLTLLCISSSRIDAFGCLFDDLIVDLSILLQCPHQNRSRQLLRHWMQVPMATQLWALLESLQTLNPAVLAGWLGSAGQKVSVPKGAAVGPTRKLAILESCSHGRLAGICWLGS